VICYLDTSAAMKLPVEEPESAALTAYLQSDIEERQRSHVALHLAVALRVGADELVTYDSELVAAATVAGVVAAQPS
jgi:predicted nucleic acid-binding protein